MKKILSWFKTPVVLIYLRNGKPFHIGTIGKCKVTVLIESDGETWLESRNLIPTQMTEEEVKELISSAGNPYNE